MPSRHYRRALINKPKILKNILINNTLTTNKIQNNSLVENIQQYFLDSIDSIILYSDMNKSIKEIQSLITIISSKEDIYTLLDTIQDTLLSIIRNISDGESIGIIECRISYIRDLLQKLPSHCYDYSQFEELFISIIDSITNNIHFNTINSNIIYIQSILIKEENTDLLNKIQEIETNILSIIQNIGDGESIGIIECRISYLKSLILELNC